MAAFYWKPPAAADLKSWEKVSDYPEPVVDVWEENWDVLTLFRQYQNQWRTGGMGIVGLDFTVFHHALDRKGITGDEYDEYLENLRVIENAAMLAISKQ